MTLKVSVCPPPPPPTKVPAQGAHLYIGGDASRQQLSKGPPISLDGAPILHPLSGGQQHLLKMQFPSYHSAGLAQAETSEVFRAQGRRDSLTPGGTSTGH